MASHEWRKIVADHGQQLLTYALDEHHPGLAARAALYFTFAGEKSLAKGAVENADELSQSRGKATVWPRGFRTHFENRFDEIYLALHELLRNETIVGALARMQELKPKSKAEVEAMELAHFQRSLREALADSRISRKLAPTRGAKPRKSLDLMALYINWLKDALAEKVTRRFLERRMARVRTAFKNHLSAQGIQEAAAEVLAHGLIGQLRNKSVVGHHAYLLHALSLLEDLLPPGSEQR